jgi:hypothetical protein
VESLKNGKIPEFESIPMQKAATEGN